MKKVPLCLAMLLLACAVTTAQVSFGEARIFDNDWRFSLSDVEDASSPLFDDASWRRVTLPHDWSAEQIASPAMASCNGYLPGGIGWYRKRFTLSDGFPRHYIYFEGVYNRSEVYLNGHLLGKRPSGFASFLYDMTPYLIGGENVLAVRVDHSRNADCRWYSGSGIYRDVWIVSAPEVHLAQWGTAYRVESMTPERALVHVDVEIERNAVPSGKLSVAVTLFDQSGKAVSKKKKVVPDVPIGNSKLSLTLPVTEPNAWNLDDPYLYNMKTELFMGGEKIDGNEIKVGLRTLEFSPEKGFALNGKNMKVKGVCLHHDAGVLGAAVPYEVLYYRLETLKSIGVNGIRGSHNPHAPMLYDICDLLGLLVIDEAFDEWEFPKRKWVQGWNVGEPSFDGTDDFFEEWGERDLVDMVRRDRNHPSIFLWSIGNEVDYPNDPYSHPVLDGSTINQPMHGGYKPDAPNAERIGMIAKRLAEVVRSVDTSRPVTGALAGVVMSNETEYPEAVDVVGYNYTENRYTMDHEMYPDRIIYGSETGRGLDSWFAVRDRDYIFGQFIWTGTDYLGESHRYPSRGMGTGLFDLATFPKPEAMQRAAVWLETPFTYVGTSLFQGSASDENLRSIRRGAPWDSWYYEDGQRTLVTCYTNAPRARLLLNGKVVGELEITDPRQASVSWMVPYEPGILIAEGCDWQGNVLSSDTLRTCGPPAAIRASLVYPEVKRDRGTALIRLDIVDEDGIPVRLADPNISCIVDGPARYLGMESGNNSDMTDHKDLHERAFMGRMMAYVQVTGEPGAVRVRFSSPLLKSAEVEFLPIE